MNTQYKYIYFEFIENKPRTQVWECRDMSHKNLGIIQWRSAWRQYCFFPSDNTLYNNQCLLDIADFINQLMEKRRSYGKTEK